MKCSTTRIAKSCIVCLQAPLLAWCCGSQESAPSSCWNSPEEDEALEQGGPCPGSNIGEAVSGGTARMEHGVGQAIFKGKDCPDFLVLVQSQSKMCSHEEEVRAVVDSGKGSSFSRTVSRTLF